MECMRLRVPCGEGHAVVDAVDRHVRSVPAVPHRVHQDKYVRSGGEAAPVRVRLEVAKRSRGDCDAIDLDADLTRPGLCRQRHRIKAAARAAWRRRRRRRGRRRRRRGRWRTGRLTERLPRHRLARAQAALQAAEVGRPLARCGRRCCRERCGRSRQRGHADARLPYASAGCPKSCLSRERSSSSLMLAATSGCSSR